MSICLPAHLVNTHQIWYTCSKLEHKRLEKA
jgi:hypothetical protein